MYLHAITVPGQLSVSVGSTTATSISLSWSVPSGSLVDSYEVMWDRVTCPDDEDEGSTTIIDGSTSHTIMALEDGSSYTITVTASNAIGSGTVSDPVSAVTNEIGETLCLKVLLQWFTQLSIIIKDWKLINCDWICKNPTF